MPQIRILVVDDSVVVRRMLSNILNEDPEISVVGAAANGYIALAKISQVNPDLVILDMDMPDMDGVETLAAIRKENQHLPVIMFSSMTGSGARVTVESEYTSLGVTDYIAKPHNMKSKEAAREYIQEQLIPKIKIFCGKSRRARNLASPKIETEKIIYHPKSPSRKPMEIVAIGVSTGGPNALEAILPQFPPNFPVPIVIVQHMPPVFTKRLAERLAQKSQIQIKEGFTSGRLTPGLAWIAPGDYHLIVERQGTTIQLRTHQEKPENSCRPAVDVLFRSVAKIYGSSTLAVVLTGMGQDGFNGCQSIREVGGEIIVQDEATSVVWGMPGIVANAGLADRVLPLPEIAGEIIRRVELFSS
ncbi:MAG TPA: chemotaxis response regulator protein-glutamate methylesterase [Cyanobacteria bacterium UBA11149]|nr:chemotaxis response regulator protein-glutamate methylesterase [Cyanobacteria bacterium UBA11367]HBE57323.1 chemotaxis response regulator protein-glutamate methylesterase [Cyanobacteria bacterium UBA11366]HBR72318.1 chemotaxis response regulator protein-glutamate methylesterase [Cyanobacteria bacterium UBA11159]HBS71687.1 chemotaxis response regulator protein-glutamate methylesterase [Cyanobacteria bacterium UBA11153]HBW89370.1 chemotaxis response regulator protein-glutamate methylesterase [